MSSFDEIVNKYLDSSKIAGKITYSHTNVDDIGLTIDGEVLVITFTDTEGHSIRNKIFSIDDHINHLKELKERWNLK